MPQADLASWLLDCIAEDERAALTGWFGHPWAEGPLPDGAVWRANYEKILQIPAKNQRGRELIAQCGWADVSRAGHIARWHPRRVLTECDAKRRAIGLHKAQLVGGYQRCAECGPCVDCAWDGHPDDSPCETLRLLALPYDDCPGYLEEWRPTVQTAG
jgi:hypothetical protein